MGIGGYEMAAITSRSSNQYVDDHGAEQNRQVDGGVREQLHRPRGVTLDPPCSPHEPGAETDGDGQVDPSHPGYRNEKERHQNHDPRVEEDRTGGGLRPLDDRKHGYAGGGVVLLVAEGQ